MIMERDDRRESQSHGLGTAALVTAIVAVVMAVIPCIGLMAVIPAIIAVSLAILGIARSGVSSGRGMLIAGLIIGVIALSLGTVQWSLLSEVRRSSDRIGESIGTSITDLADKIRQEIDRGGISIIIDDDGDRVEIRTRVDHEKLEERLERLEKLEGIEDEREEEGGGGR